MAFKFRLPFTITKPVTQEQASLTVIQNAPEVPQKVYIERLDDGFNEYSTQRSNTIERFYNLLHGYYSPQNFLELFYCLPEVFAPIHEIASRVADCNWQLCKDWNDEVDYSDDQFNKLFSTPNPLQEFTTLVYWQVVYEILTGAQFDFFNRSYLLATEPGNEYKNILTWVNLPAHQVVADIKKTDPYTATEISDFVNSWKVPVENGRYRIFNTDSIIPTLHLSIDKPFDLNCRKSLLLGAEKPIKNLIPVYEARGVIYIKRGALGFVVSRKSDESGQQALTPGEKEEAQKDFNQKHGLTGDRDLINVTSLPVDFVRTGMSIEELQPFDETLSDAVAIYKVLRVPRHLVPSKDTSTFANANEDMKSFYADVIMPIARKKAKLWTNYLRIPRRYVNANFDHVKILQADRKLEAEVNQIMGNVWSQRWLSGVCCLNDWISANEGDTIKNNPIFEKKLPELTPKELEVVKGFLNLKAVAPIDHKKDKTKKDADNKAA